MDITKFATPQIRKANREEVFELIKKGSDSTIARIGATLELSRPTVTNIVEELEAAGLITREKQLVKTGGRNAASYVCNAQAKAAVGIQISPHHIRGVVVDLMGNVLNSSRQRRELHVDELYRKEIGEVYRELISGSGLEDSRVTGVGLTVQALTNSEGTKVTYVPSTSLQNETYEGIAKYIPVRSRLFHDLYALGYNKNLWVDENVFYLSVNTSIGGTILVKDKIYYGSSNKAGEVGHLQLMRNGRKCYCGNSGCFDAYCNTTVLSSFAGGTLEDFFIGLEEGRDGYAAVWTEYLDYLASAIFSIRMIFDGVIIVGGELGRYARYFLDDLRSRVDRKTFFPGESASDYLRAYESGEYAIAVGAAMYYVDHVLDDF